MIPLREPEPNRHASGGLQAQRIDQLLPQQTHRRRAENDDPLLVQADDSLIRPEIEEFCEVQVLPIRRVVATRLRLDSGTFYAQELRHEFLGRRV